MKITKSRLRQIIMEELEGEQSSEPALEKQPESPSAPSAYGGAPRGGIPAISTGDFEGMAHAAVAAIVQLAAEAGVDMDISTGPPPAADFSEPPESPMQEEDISLSELKKLIKSELLG